MENQDDWRKKKTTKGNPVSVKEAISVAKSLFGIIPDSVSLEEVCEERLKKKLSV